MVYQRGTVYLQGARQKKWYGKFRVYERDQNGREVEKTRKIVLGSESVLCKWEAAKKLEEIILRENGSGRTGFVNADGSVSLGWLLGVGFQWILLGGWDL